jgi:non-homologous end joining protein Ku
MMEKKVSGRDDVKQLIRKHKRQLEKEGVTKRYRDALRHIKRSKLKRQCREAEDRRAKKKVLKLQQILHEKQKRTRHNMYLIDIDVLDQI